jgi:uncharacterized protein (TIGR02996 family)
MSEVADRLYAQIVATPHDLTLRQIYADHLLDAGDPRGELISLQLANRDPDRVAWLVESHGRAWIGPLGTWVRFSACAFENGFLAEVALADPKRDLTPLVGHPIWATVRALHLGPVKRVSGSAMLRSAAALIAQPVMRSLTSVTVDDGEGLMLVRDREGALMFVPQFR